MALKLFDSLFKAGLTPDARTYSAVMIACFKGHQVSHGLMLVVMLRLLVLLVLVLVLFLARLEFSGP